MSPVIHEGRPCSVFHAEASRGAPFLFSQEDSSLIVLTSSMLPCFPPSVPSCFTVIKSNHKMLPTKILTNPNATQQRQSQVLGDNVLRVKRPNMARLPVVRTSVSTNEDVQFRNFCDPNHAETCEIAKCSRLVNTI